MDSSKIVDNMQPYEFRFKRNRDFSESILPLTKNGEQYFLIKQQDDMYNSIHYYVIGNSTQVIGRFDIGINPDKSASCSYFIINEFQNRGIGQTVLEFVVEDVFNNQNIDRILILPTNDRSAAIASKIGFSKKSRSVYELRLLDYQKSQSSRRQKY